MNTINIAIADDHSLIVEGLVKILREFERIGEIRTAFNGKELLKLLKSFTPDVILLDIEMPVMGGIEACELIVQKYPIIKIIGLTQHAEEAAICHLIGAGANGYLLKNTKPEELFSAISYVIKHDFYGNDLTQNAFIKSNRKEHKKEDYKPKIEVTSREKLILKYTCMEKNSIEIGELLCISSRTVEHARSQLIKKIGVKGIIGLTKFAVEEGYHV